MMTFEVYRVSFYGVNSCNIAVSDCVFESALCGNLTLLLRSLSLI